MAVFQCAEVFGEASGTVTTLHIICYKMLQKWTIFTLFHMNKQHISCINLAHLSYFVIQTLKFSKGLENVRKMFCSPTKMTLLRVAQ